MSTTVFVKTNNKLDFYDTIMYSKQILSELSNEEYTDIQILNNVEIEEEGFKLTINDEIGKQEIGTLNYIFSTHNKIQTIELV